MSKSKRINKLGRSISGILSIMVLLLALAPISVTTIEATKNIYVSKQEAYRGETVRFYTGGMGTGTVDGSLGLAFTNKVTLTDGTVIINDQNFPSGIVFYDPAPLNPGDSWVPFTVVGVLDGDGKAIPHYGADASGGTGGGDFSGVGFQYFFPYARPYFDEFSLYIDVEVPTNLPAAYTDAKFEMFFDLYNVQTYGEMHVPQYLVRFPQINYDGRPEAAAYPLAAVPTDFTLVYPAQRIIPAGAISPAWWWALDDAVGHFFVRTRDAGETGSLSITKTVDGDPAPDDSFSFLVMKNNARLTGTYMVTGPNAPVGPQTITDGWVVLKAGQTATITDLEVGADYRVSENHTGEHYTTSFTITGGTTQSGVGRSTDEFAIVKDATTAVIFKNTYTRTPKLNLEGIKLLTTLDGAPLSIVEGEFAFMLTPDANNPVDGCVWSGSNPIGVAADGSIDFGTLTFKKEGTYVFIAEEVIPNPVPAGWTYDTKPQTVRVTIEDIDGHLRITSTDYKMALLFTNVCGEVLGTDSTLVITKMDSNGKPLSGIEFYLMVSSDNGDTWVDYATTHMAPYFATNSFGKLVFRDLPAGMYKIIEITEDPAYGKPIYSPSDSFTIRENEILVVEVSVVNPLRIPVTGDHSSLKQWVGLSVLATIGMICCGMALMRKRRKNK